MNLIVPGHIKKIKQAEAQSKMEDYQKKISDIGNEILELLSKKQLKLIDAKNVLTYVEKKIEMNYMGLNINYIMNNSEDKKL